MGFSATSETETETPPPPLQSTSAKSHPPLPNFSFPLLKWSNQRFLRCMKDDPTVDRDASRSHGPAQPPTRPPPAATRKTPSPASIDNLHTLPQIVAENPGGDSATDDAAIEEIRERLWDHLRSAADKMRFRVPEEEKESASTPWNLRKRRSASKYPAEIGATMPPPPPPPPPPVVQESQVRSMRSRTAAAAAANEAVQGKEKPKEKRKLTVALSKEEIKEDFLAMTGSRPARRPKKRLGKVQRQLDLSFPGLWLSDITVEAYRVPESHETAKG